MKKVLYVATVVKTHIMEFHIPYLKMFKEKGWETSVAAKNDYENLNDCSIPYCDHYYDIPFERFPIKRKNIQAYKLLKKIIEEEHFDIIHCHTPVGAMLARLAAKDVRNNGTKVIYTAHGFHFYTGAPLINWILYYPVERWLAHYTDVLITINKEDYERAKKFKVRQVEYIPGVGIDVEKFYPNPCDRDKKRQELGINSDDIVLLSVGELNENKNHRLIIELLPYLKNNIFYVICGKGPLMEEYINLANKLGIQKRLKLMGYVNDTPNYYRIADLFVFPSKREGLPVSIMEAMASGLPIIATDIRGSRDLLGDSSNVLFSLDDDRDYIIKSINKLLKNRADVSKENVDRAKMYNNQVIIKSFLMLLKKLVVDNNLIYLVF